MSELNLKTSIVIDDGRHNGFPDLICWRDYFYLAFRSAKSHIDKHSSIKLLRSIDAKEWEMLAEFRLPDEDIRDPKFALVGGELFLYALKNKEVAAMPYTTIYSTSADGVHWSAWEDVSPVRWVFWRPKTRDGRTWYVAADERGHNRSALFSSTDGRNWEKISTIYSGEFHAEIELVFLANTDLACTIRVEGLAGNSRTILGSSKYPYTHWELVPSRLTRLDGASSFTHNGHIFSVGRFEPAPLFGTGNLLNQKRTSLFGHTPGRISWLLDFPSAGDTGYASALLSNGTALIAYYTGDPEQDYPWVIGQFKPTQIRMARLELRGLELLAERD